ncbi:macB-like periplasmic core domain protein, partial [Vibrio parahaemolyticus V-223/04]
RTLAFHSAIAARFSFLKQRTAICGMRNLGWY